MSASMPFIVEQARAYAPRTQHTSSASRRSSLCSVLSAPPLQWTSLVGVHAVRWRFVFECCCCSSAHPSWTTQLLVLKEAKRVRVARSRSARAHRFLSGVRTGTGQLGPWFLVERDAGRWGWVLQPNGRIHVQVGQVGLLGLRTACKEPDERAGQLGAVDGRHGSRCKTYAVALSDGQQRTTNYAPLASGVWHESPPAVSTSAGQRERAVGEAGIGKDRKTTRCGSRVSNWEVASRSAFKTSGADGVVVEQ